MYVDRGREISIAVFLGVIGLVLLVFAPGFFETGNLRNLMVSTSYVAIGSFGAMLAILTGQPDISVGSILAVCAFVSGSMAVAGIPIVFCILASIGVGALLGLVNGLLVTGLNIHAIIVTLGTLSIYRGGLLYFTGGRWVYDLPPGYREIGLGRILGIPNPVWIAILTLVVGAWILRNTAWGRSLYAVGSNTEAARLSGIGPKRMLITAFVANGALVGLATLALATRFSTIQSNVGTGFEFLVITAVVVGGAHIFGGSGTVVGITLGALLVGVTGTVLVFLEISAFWERTLHGLFILLAVGYGVLRERRRSVQTTRTAEEAA